MPLLKLSGNLCHIFFVFDCYVIVYKTIYIVLKTTPLYWRQPLTGRLVVASRVINIYKIHM